MFKHIKLTTVSSSWITCINPNMSNEEIEKHFLNEFFDVGVYPIEKMEKVLKVEFLTDYLVSFNGRTLGAIGAIQYFKCVKVSGYNEEDARLNLYNNYDTIRGLNFINSQINIS